MTSEKCAHTVPDENLYTPIRRVQAFARLWADFFAIVVSHHVTVTLLATQLLFEE